MYDICNIELFLLFEYINNLLTFVFVVSEDQSSEDKRSNVSNDE